MFADTAWLNQSAVMYWYFSPPKRVAKSQECKGRTAEKRQWSAMNCPGVHYLGIPLDIPKWHHFVPNLWLSGWHLLNVLANCASAAVLQEKLPVILEMGTVCLGDPSIDQVGLRMCREVQARVSNAQPQSPGIKDRWPQLNLLRHPQQESWEFLCTYLSPWKRNNANSDFLPLKRKEPLIFQCISCFSCVQLSESGLWLTHVHIHSSNIYWAAPALHESTGGKQE